MASSLLLPTASHIAALSSLHIHGFSTSRIQQKQQQQQSRFLRPTRVPLFHNAATPSFQEGLGSNNASSKAAVACGDDDDDEDVDEAAAAALKQLESTSNSVLDFAAANFLPIGWCGLACLLLHCFCVFPDSVETILLLEAFCPP
jgi:hypothetical protein